MKIDTKKGRGFTLVELLIVVGIVIVLTAVIITSVEASRAKGRDARRLVDATQFGTALELYASDNGGSYPPIPSESIYFTSKGVNSTPQCPESGNDWTDNSTSDPSAPQYVNNFISSMKPYISQLPKDPVNDSQHCYVYASVPSTIAERADVAALYGVHETGTYREDTVGVVTGNTANYSHTGGRHISFILHVTPPTQGSGTANTVVQPINTRYVVIEERGMVFVSEGRVSVRYSPSGSSEWGSPRILFPNIVQDPISIVPPVIMSNVSTATGNVQTFTTPSGDRVEVTAL